MVSRQETARPLLTPGEVMQLPATDELVLVSGCPPIRATKARYFEDERLAERFLPPPRPTKPAAMAARDDWTDLPAPIPREHASAQRKRARDSPSRIRRMAVCGVSPSCPSTKILYRSRQSPHPSSSLVRRRATRMPFVPALCAPPLAVLLAKPPWTRLTASIFEHANQAHLQTPT